MYVNDKNKHEILSNAMRDLFQVFHNSHTQRKYPDGLKIHMKAKGQDCLYSIITKLLILSTYIFYCFRIDYHREAKVYNIRHPALNVRLE